MSASQGQLAIQDRDSCLALVFLLLIIWVFYKTHWLVYAAMAVLLYGMIWPKGMRPFTLLWFGLSRVLGHVVGSILLGVIWCVMVVPVGLIRRLMGKDSLRLKQWHKGTGSAFVNRDHKYSASDISTPY